MRICPKCRAYYADAQLGFCLADGTPLVNVDPRSEQWNEGTRAFEEKAKGLSRQRRRLKWRRIVLGAMTALVLTMLVVTSFTVETTSPKLPPSPTPTPSLTLSPSQTPSLSPSPSPSLSPSPSPSLSPSPSPSPSPTPSPTPGYKISGRVTAGQSLGPVTITLEGARAASTTTDSSGNYAFSDLRAGSYTITPRGQMKFRPPSRSFNNLRRDESADFIVETEVVKISGRVTSASQPMGRVKISLEGSKLTSTTTDANGYYTFSDLRAGGSYTITPSGQTNFKPSSRAFDNLRRDESADFFGLVPDVYKITGRVTSADQALNGVTIRLGGSKTASTSTDAEGNYTFRDLRAGGNYDITPPLNFRPSSRSFNNLQRDESANFVALAKEDSISTDTCTALDQEREKNNLLNRNGAAWAQSFESEKSAVIAKSIAENWPVGVEPNQVEATASLGPITYTVIFLKGCKPNLVMASYEWRVSMHARSETKIVKVQKRKTCGKVFGLWVCRPV